MFLFRIFGKGVMVILPFAIVAWLLVFLFGVLDNIWQIILGMVQWVIEGIVQKEFGMTLSSTPVSICLLVLTFLVIFYVGYKFEKEQNAIFIKIGEWIVSKIPIIGSIYYTLKDLIGMIGGSSQDKYLGVAFVPIGDGEIMGFITKEEDEYFWVFCPLTPPTSGLLMRIHKDKMKKSSMSVAEGLKKVVSFGMK